MTESRNEEHNKQPFTQRYPSVHLPGNTEDDLKRMYLFLHSEFYPAIPSAYSISPKCQYTDPAEVLGSSFRRQVHLESGLVAVLNDKTIGESRTGEDVDQTLVRYLPPVRLGIHVQKNLNRDLETSHRELEISLGFCVLETEQNPLILFQAKEQRLGLIENYYAETFYQPFSVPSPWEYVDRSSLFFGPGVSVLFGDRYRSVADIVSIYNAGNANPIDVFGKPIIHNASLDTCSTELLEAIDITSRFII